jgi:uncharacterized DUF497 family protein
MTDLRFEWDPAKAATNLRKHGVSFDEARAVFSDERAKLIADPDTRRTRSGSFCSVSARACVFWSFVTVVAVGAT